MLFYSQLLGKYWFLPSALAFHQKPPFSMKNGLESRCSRPFGYYSDADHESRHAHQLPFFLLDQKSMLDVSMSIFYCERDYTPFMSRALYILQQTSLKSKSNEYQMSCEMSFREFVSVRFSASAANSICKSMITKLNSINLNLYIFPFLRAPTTALNNNVVN